MNITAKVFIKKALLPFTFAAILSSCGTTPASNYYLLSAQTTHIPTESQPSLGVGPIEIPQYLNRNAFLYNRDGNHLHIASYDRWAEPLDSGIGRVVKLTLASLLNTENVQGYPWTRDDQPQYGVEVSVLSLDANDKTATLIAEWRLHRPQEEVTVTRRISEFKHELPDGPVEARDIAPAYSNLLHQLSEVIAAAISQDYESRQTTENN